MAMIVNMAPASTSAGVGTFSLSRAQQTGTTRSKSGKAKIPSRVTKAVAGQLSHCVYTDFPLETDDHH